VTGAAGAGEVPGGRVGQAPPIQSDAAATAQATANNVKTIAWGNGAPRGAEEPDETPPTAALGDQTGGSEGAIGKNPEKAAKDRDEPLKVGDDEDAAPAAAKTDDEPSAAAEPPAARRSTALANLEAERKTRALEATVKDLQKKLEASEPVAKSIREGTLAQRVKALGLSKADQAELLEKLLVKDPELDGAPDAPATAPRDTPELAALKETVKELQRRLDSRDGNEEAAQIARAEAAVADGLKDVDLPLTHSEVPVTIDRDGKPAVVTPYHLVLLTANQMWLDSGKNGHPKDYVKRAGANVEAHLREKNPKLAARLDAQKTVDGAAAPVPVSSGGPSLGKRTGKGAPTNPPKLPRDRDARDQVIKKDMGWY